MEPTPFEIDIALAEILAASTPGLRIRYLGGKQAWVLEAAEPCARFHETAGLVNPAPGIFEELLSELESLAAINKRLKMFSVPDCARMRQEAWEAGPFQPTPEYACRHYLVYDARKPLGSLALSKEKHCPVTVRKADDPVRLEMLTDKMAARFFPEKRVRSLGLQLMKGMAKKPACDFLEFNLGENEILIGGMIASYHDGICHLSYGFIESDYRGRGFLYHLPVQFQKTALRATCRFIIGETLQYTLRPGLRTFYERLGATLLYSRCYYAIDFFGQPQ